MTYYHRDYEIQVRVNILCLNFYYADTGPVPLCPKYITNTDN